VIVLLGSTVATAACMEPAVTSGVDAPRLAPSPSASATGQDEAFVEEAQPTGDPVTIVNQGCPDRWARAEHPFQQGATLKAIVDAEKRAKRCGDDSRVRGQWRLQLVYLPSGCVYKAGVVDGSPGEPTATCILRAYLTGSVQPFEGTPVHISKMHRLP